MDEYREAYRILLDGVISAMDELDHQRWEKAGEILAAAQRNAEKSLDPDEAAIVNEALFVPIHELGLPIHEYHILQRAGLRHLADVIALGPKELRKLRNCGAKAYQTILDKLAESGFVITDEWLYWIDHRAPKGH